MRGGCKVGQSAYEDLGHQELSTLTGLKLGGNGTSSRPGVDAREVLRVREGGEGAGPLNNEVVGWARDIAESVEPLFAKFDLDALAEVIVVD